jgi:hypothetical protein
LTSVLGTRIEPLRAVAERALLVSDLHIGSDGGAALAHLRWAIAAAAAQRASLLVLGDLFDSYVSRAQVRHGVWREVADLFARAVADGVPVAMLVGNRDFLLGDEFVAASRVPLSRGGLRGWHATCRCASPSRWPRRRAARAGWWWRPATRPASCRPARRWPPPSATGRRGWCSATSIAAPTGASVGGSTGCSRPVTPRPSGCGWLPARLAWCDCPPGGI